MTAQTLQYAAKSGLEVLPPVSDIRMIHRSKFVPCLHGAEKFCPYLRKPISTATIHMQSSLTLAREKLHCLLVELQDVDVYQLQRVDHMGRAVEK